VPDIVALSNNMAAGSKRLKMPFVVKTVYSCREVILPFDLSARLNKMSKDVF